MPIAIKAKKRRIAFITERRADYSRLRPLLKEAYASTRIEPLLIVTGSHLLHSVGHTKKWIIADGFVIHALVRTIDEKDSDTGSMMAKAFGRAVIGMTDAFLRLKPDIIVAGFDLGAHLAAAIAGAHLNIHVAHLEGGGVSGSVDDTLRHALTKFSHLHFPATAESKDRIIRLGEDPRYVFETGSLSIDTVKSLMYVPKETICEKYGLNPEKKLIVFLEHPVTTEEEEASAHIKESLSAITMAARIHQAEVLAIYPNIDTGGKRIRASLKISGVKAVPHIPYDDFLRLLKVADVLVGNSSSGIQEAPSFGLPAVNIGTRQQFRERGNNLVDVHYKREEILDAIKKALCDVKFIAKVKAGHNPYGGGEAAKKIISILESIELPPIQKVIPY